MTKFIRAQSVTSLGEDSVVSGSIIVNGDVTKKSVTRSPLQSTSSLELTPNMEQVCERLSAVQVTTPPRPLVTNSALHRLWPQPKRITELKGNSWKMPHLINLCLPSGPFTVHE